MRVVLALLAFASLTALKAQVIEFESGGLKFKTLTRNGVTVMFAPLPAHIREYAVLQVAVSNGSKIPWVVKPEDFVYQRGDGQIFKAMAAKSVVAELIEHGGRNDVIKLITAYEASVFGNARMKSTNGYEARRQAAHAELGSAKLKAAAAASAIAMVSMRLKPGDSTDGAIFYALPGKSIAAGKLRVTTAGEVFEFDVEPPAHEGSH